MKLFFALLVLLTTPVLADDLTFGGAYGFSGNADGAIVGTAQYNFTLLNQPVYAGVMGFIDDPNGSSSTVETCTTTHKHDHGYHDRKPTTTCTTSKTHSDNNVNAGFYAGWRAVKVGNFDAGIGVIAFDKSDVMTEGHTTAHAIANYHIGPVVLTYQYAGGSFAGVGFNFPLGHKPQSWTVERVK